MKKMAAAWLACGVLAAGWGNDSHAHGESIGSVGGAGTNTVSAIPVEGAVLGLRFLQRGYRLRSDEELLALQAQGQDVHQHALEQSVFLSGTVGLTENTDITLQLPFNRFRNFRDNSDEYALANNAISVTDTSKGIGDLLLLGRYRFWRGDDHHLAVLAAIEFPTGEVNQKTNQGEIVGTHNQPGSGSWDSQFGVAYTGHWRDVIGVSADLIARFNSPGAGEFRSGNSLNADLAFAYEPHATFVPFLEFNAIFQERDTERGHTKLNSGVHSIFVAPGFRWNLGRRYSLFGSVAVPVYQELPGIQNKEAYRVNIGLGIVVP